MTIRGNLLVNVRTAGLTGALALSLVAGCAANVAPEGSEQEPSDVDSERPLMHLETQLSDTASLRFEEVRPGIVLAELSADLEADAELQAKMAELPRNGRMLDVYRTAVPEKLRDATVLETLEAADLRAQALNDSLDDDAGPPVEDPLVEKHLEQIDFANGAPACPAVQFPECDQTIFHHNTSTAWGSAWLGDTKIFQSSAMNRDTTGAPGYVVHTIEIWVEPDDGCSFTLCGYGPAPGWQVEVQSYLSSRQISSWFTNFKWTQSNVRSVGNSLTPPNSDYCIFRRFATPGC